MKVSIITVTYNSAETVEDTIQSVLSQSYADIEYIIVDGKSKDNTMEIVGRYADQIDQVISEPDKGMYDGLNKGIKMAKGDLIGILNSDDLYTDINVIADVVESLKKEEAEAVYADLQYVDRLDLNKVIRHWRSGKYKAGMFRRGWMPPHPTFFVKAECYQKFGGFNLDLVSAADYELMLRLIHKHEIRLAYLPRVIVRMREGGMSNQSLKNRLRANREDRKAWEINGLKAHRMTFLMKPVRKVGQFFFK